MHLQAADLACCFVMNLPMDDKGCPCGQNGHPVHLQSHHLMGGIHHHRDFR